MTYHLKSSKGRRYCNPKLGGMLVMSLDRCNCFDCLQKLKGQLNGIKPRYRILWSHNLFADSMFATDERPILGYFIQDVTKLPSLAGAKYYSL